MSQQNTPKIESHDLTVSALFKDFYSVPDFQREYVWGQEEVERLLQDLYDEFYGEEGQLLPGPEYFLGSMVTCKAEDGTFQLIDGQQRMTTLYLILCVIRDALREAKAEASKVLDSQIADADTDPRTFKEVERFRVTLQYADSEGVLDKIASGLANSGTITEGTASVRNILAAYRSIREFLSTNIDGQLDKLREFHGILTTRVKLIRIVTPTITNALKVFETINDRGVGLTAMDLLKNLLFMRVTSAQYPKLKERWKVLVDTLDGCKEKPLRFLRYYIMAHYEIDYRRGIREDEIYAWFVKNAGICGIEDDPLEFLEGLIECGKAHANFLASKDSQGNDSRYLRNLGLLGGALRQQYILLMAARMLPPSLFERLCQAIENLFFCYIITRESGKTYERNFAKWSAELRAVRDAEGLATFIEKNYKPELEARSSTFDFRLQELAESRIQQYRMRYILAKLTQFIDEQAWDCEQSLEKYINKDVHVEHILSQNPTQETRAAFDKQDEYNDYVERLGNLMLLEKPINASIGNGPLEKKAPGYKQSSFLLTKSLVEQPHVGTDTSVNRAVSALQQFETWDSKAIETRQVMLTQLARKVWNMPEKAPAEEATE